jgi:hypothetical protein
MRQLLKSLATATLVTGCATAPIAPPQAIDNVNVLDGTWKGNISSSLGTSRTELVIKNGQYRAVEGPALDLATPGEIWLDGDRTVFESVRSVGTVTLHERDGKRVIQLDGKNKDGQPDFSAEMTEAPIAPPQAIDNVNVLDGTWKGNISSSLGTSRTEWVIKNGQYRAVEGPGLDLTTPGEIWLDGDRTVFESVRSVGTVTLHERDGKRVIRLDGKSKDAEPDFSAEMTEAK